MAVRPWDMSPSKVPAAAGGRRQQVPGVRRGAVEALEQVLGLIQHVLHVVDHVVKHRGQQGVRQLLQLAARAMVSCSTAEFSFSPSARVFSRSRS